MAAKTDKEKLKGIAKEKKERRSRLKKNRISGGLKRRVAAEKVLSVLWLFAAAYIYLRTDSFVGPALISGAVVLYAALLILGSLSGKKLAVSIDTDARMEKDQGGTARIRIRNGSRTPVLKGYLLLATDNVLTGEKKEMEVPFSVGGHGAAEQVVDLKSSRCGKVLIETKAAFVTVPLCLRCVIREAEAKAAAVVMPGIAEIETEESSREALDMESFRYSQVKKGTDPSETFNLREYQPGDSVKRIHWKLTYKTGDVMIKEASYPIYNSMLLLLETSFRDRESLKPEWMDAMAEAMMSVASALTDRGVSYEVGIYDNGEGKLFLKRIDSEDDLWAAAGSILGARRAAAQTDAVTRFREEFSGQPFAHMVYVTAGKEEADFSAFSGESVISVLRCGAKGITEGEITEYGFLPETWEQDLEYIRI